ncbi:Uncharacterised protein [Streptococcus hyointestinalis]|uniref:Uncharacterized protein n=1 Tax=Streptococcus hyointestinalis TaxID=1337 RepID=A0A380K635_9STRE|nr:Uncharacterised protein [Streptococcus hyointestinalis]
MQRVYAYLSTIKTIATNSDTTSETIGLLLVT